MPSVNLSPLFNAQQLFTAAGIPLNGGLINTYLAGTNTPAATYTDSGGTTLNNNPIQLDAGGLLPNEVWLINATAYKFVVTDSAGANSRTYDNITAALGSSSAATSFSTVSNAASFFAKLQAVGGVTGYEVQNQLGNRTADFLYWGASSAPLYGMTAGWAGINTPSGVGFTIGTNDTVRMTFSPTTNDITAQGIAITRVKTATTSRSSVTGLGDDPHLLAALGLGTFSFEVWIPVWGTGSGIQGFKYQMFFSGTATGAASAGLAYQNATLQATVCSFAGPVNTGLIDVGTGVTGVGWFRITGTLTVTVTGNLSLQWAQVTSGANATNVGIGGWMNVMKVG